jgi:hypothetical protein
MLQFSLVYKTVVNSFNLPQFDYIGTSRIVDIDQKGMRYQSVRDYCKFWTNMLSLCNNKGMKNGSEKYDTKASVTRYRVHAF